MWRGDDTLPMWMKPSLIGVIVDRRKTTSGIPYIHVHEAGSVLDARVLSWLIEYAISEGHNLFWTVDDGPHYLGSTEFVTEMSEK